MDKRKPLKSEEQKLAELIGHASSLAFSLRQKVFTTTHLLRESLRYPEAKEQLRFWSIDIKGLEKDLATFWESTFDPEKNTYPIEVNPLPKPQPTTGVERVLARFRKRKVEFTREDFGQALLTSMLYDRESLAVGYLRTHGLTIELPTEEYLTGDELFVAEHAVSKALRDSKNVDPTLLRHVETFVDLLAHWKENNVPHDRIMRVIDTLVVNPMEVQLDKFIATLTRVNEADREALANNLATLVRAPDSASVKEKVLMGLAGNNAFGYQPPSIRQDARALLDSVDESQVRKHAAIRRQKELSN